MQTISRALREHSVLSLRNKGRLYLPSFGLKSVAFTQLGAGVVVSHSADLNLVALQKFPGEFPAKFRRLLTPRPLTAASWILPPLFIFGRHFSSCHLRPIARSQPAVKHIAIHLPKSILFGYYHSFFWCVPEVQDFSSSSNMAASGKIDLNSPSTSWKEAKNFLKGLDTKKRREHYGIKDYIKLKEIPTWKDTAKKMKIKQPEEVKYPKNKDLLDKISVFRGDITKLELDAIVTSANSSLLGGGGVDGCIHRAAGPLLKLESSSLGGCNTGQAKLTGGYSLPAKWVIHTVGPVAQGQPGTTQEEELKNCYRNCLKVAAESKLRTLAFPSISTGVFGYPAEDAANVALGTIRTFLEENKEKFDRIILCVFLEKDEELYLQKMPEYFPFA